MFEYSRQYFESQVGVCCLSLNDNFVWIIMNCYVAKAEVNNCENLLK